MSDLTWRQVQANAAKFAEEWKDASYEKGEAKSFYNDFFQDIFGVKRRSVARYEEHVKKLDNRSGFIDLFWPGVLIVEQKSLGGDLEKAAGQAGEYFDALEEYQKPRYQLVCDFQTFELYDREEGTSINFRLQELPDHVQDFAFILGKQYGPRRSQEPLNLDAARLVAKLYRGLKDAQYPSSHLEKLLVRIVFCLFAGDTGIFQPRGLFADLVDSRSRGDGSDLGNLLAHLFQVLNDPEAKRQRGLDPDLAEFPYINGDLFAAPIPIAAFDKTLRGELVEMTSFDWSKISPAIFGELFQSVLTNEELREDGGHSTSEKNILKVIDDLFLDTLKKDLETALASKSGQRAKLTALRDRIRQTKVLDPACGCGNFLVVAYRELRRIEHKILIELNKGKDPSSGAFLFPIVDVDQFYGIESRHYSARIAESAMWMTDHVLNNEFSLAMGIDFHRIPLRTSPQIHVGDALDMDWRAVIPLSECDYIVGNPPYSGSKRLSGQRAAQIKKLADGPDYDGTLDYAAGWFVKAAEFAAQKARVSFVCTNSLVRGEQVAQLWPLLYSKYDIEIVFGHQTFAWITDSTKKANVHVVIVGFCARKSAPINKRLYSYADYKSNPVPEAMGAISPYLINGDRLNNHRAVVSSSRKPRNDLKRLRIGSKPVDGGYFVLNEYEMTALVRRSPGLKQFIRPYVGGEEFLAGEQRYILYLVNASPSELRKYPAIGRIVRQVREWRHGRIPNKAGNRYRGDSRELADQPLKYHVTVVPDEPFLVIPEVSSERREYIPIAWLEPPTIPSNLVKILSNATLIDFALLTSAMHMAWVRVVGGALESRYRYSIYVLYNNFPVPKIEKPRLIEAAARKVLKVRKEHAGESLESLYDPDTMPVDLRRAHRALDRVVDRVYLGKPASSDVERIENLLNRYESI